MGVGLAPGIAALNSGRAAQHRGLLVITPSAGAILAIAIFYVLQACFSEQPTPHDKKRSLTRAFMLRPYHAVD